MCTLQFKKIIFDYLFDYIDYSTPIFHVDCSWNSYQWARGAVGRPLGRDGGVRGESKDKEKHRHALEPHRDGLQPVLASSPPPSVMWCRCLPLVTSQTHAPGSGATAAEAARETWSRCGSSSYRKTSPWVIWVASWLLLHFYPPNCSRISLRLALTETHREGNPRKGAQPRQADTLQSHCSFLRNLI